MGHDKRPIVRARDAMQPKVIYIDGMATAREAAVKMRAEKVRSLLVKKRDENDAWGIVVVQDFIRKVVTVDRSPDEVHIYEIMTKPVITVPADMDVRYVARLLTRASLGRVPVVEDNGELIGTISLSALILGTELV